MFTVEVSPQAAQDLLEIKNYIENELQNPISAHNTVEKIVETYEDLAIFPEIGIPVERYVIMSYFVNTKKSTGLRCISYTACLYSSSLRWKDSYISSGTL